MRRGGVARRMSFTEAEIARVARLARLALAPGEADLLASQLAAITRDFEGLAAYASVLPDAAPEPAGAPRDDVVEPSSPDVLSGATRRQSDGAIRAAKGAGG